MESKIYAVEKFGWKKISMMEYPEEKNSEIATRMLRRRMHGRLSFLHMIRGAGDWVCADLSHRFNTLHSDAILRVPSVEVIARRERVVRGTVVVACYKEAVGAFAITSNQGTAFCTQSGLFVTAAHVLICEDSNEKMPYVYVMNERSMSLEQCDVLAFDAHKDVAVLRVQPGHIDLTRHRFKLGAAVSAGENVGSVGYPDYVKGASASVQKHQVVKCFVASLVKKFQVNGVVQGGLSGGPVFNDKFEVVGLVHKGILAPGGVPEVVSVEEIKSVAAGVPGLVL